LDRKKTLFNTKKTFSAKVGKLERMFRQVAEKNFPLGNTALNEESIFLKKKFFRKSIDKKNFCLFFSAEIKIKKNVFNPFFPTDFLIFMFFDEE